MDIQETEIAIVGYGPIGALMANLLGARGISTIVVERETEIFQLPRAVGMDDEVRRVLQNAELQRAYEDGIYTLRGMDLLRPNRTPLRRLRIDNEPQTLGHPVFTLFHQPTLEAHIRDGAKRYAQDVDIRLGVAVQNVIDHADYIDLETVDLSTEQICTIRAKYVLGCDGGRSAIRKAFSVEQHDLGLHQPWIVVDAKMKRPIEKTGFAEQICDPKRPGTFIPSPPPRNRWEFMVMPGDDQEKLLETKFLNELIRPWADPEDYEIERGAIYTFHALIAKQWRVGKRGRAILMGDAAHQMPPFLGQGMCAGVRDAFNLVWKLELVVRGQAESSILDTYQEERAHHVRQVIELAVSIGKIIQSGSPFKAFIANTTMVLAERLHLNAQIRTMKTIPFNSGFYSAAHPPKIKSRCPFPQPNVQLSDGENVQLDQVLGTQFALLTTSEETTSDDPLIRHIKFHPPHTQMKNVGTDEIIDREDAIRKWMRQNRCQAVLLRPDRQPFGVYSDQCATTNYTEKDLHEAIRKSQMNIRSERHMQEVTQ